MENAMTIDDVMRKYRMSVENVLNVREIYGGTVSIAPDVHLIFFEKCGKLCTSVQVIL